MPAHDLAILDIVAFADPAGGKNVVKRVQARSAIVVLGGGPNDHVFLLHAWAQRTTTDRFVDMIFALNEAWRPRLFGIEANAMQTLFADSVRREARFRADRIPLVDVLQPTNVEKPFRNRAALQPIINDSRFFMLDDVSQIEARDELKSHPMSPTFDIVDSIASAAGLLRKQPREDALADDLSGLAVYLRRSGMPPTQIEGELAKRRMQLRAGGVPPIPPRQH